MFPILDVENEVLELDDVCYTEEEPSNDKSAVNTAYEDDKRRFIKGYWVTTVVDFTDKLQLRECLQQVIDL